MNTMIVILSIYWYRPTKLYFDWPVIYVALQQNREQVVLAYLEIWALEVGIGVKNDSSVNFEIIFLYVP